MKRQFFIWPITLFLFTPLFAQQPEEKLNTWAEQTPIEKIYLHLDRNDYVAGQTIWFKAYLASDFLPADKSTVLFVELLNNSSLALSRQILPVVRAVSQGQFQLPDTLSSGNYIIRAYTATMLNHDAGFLYKRNITVAGKEQKKAALPASGKKIRLEFFPEGGNFVAGLSNTIAFKATDQHGFPVGIAGKLMNGKNEIITEFSSIYDGMGMFDVDARANEGYYAIIKDDPAGQKYFLPEPSAAGIVFRLLTGNDGIHFEIFQKKNDPVFQAAYMIGQMQHHVVFKQPLKEGTASLTGMIKTGNLSSGILHITVFNKDGMPLAERLSFVNNKEYIKTAELTADTLGFSPRSKNHFTLSFKDSVTGSFSVSVTDTAFQSSVTREENIFSGFLLSSDLKGYVHNPAYYFSADTDTVKAALDLLMMTHGWRRFKWEQLLKDPLPGNKYKDPAFASLSGRVTLEGTQKPFADKTLLMYIVAADSSKSMQLVTTDINGRFRADSLLFFSKAKILLSDIKGKKSKFVDITPGPDSLHRFYAIPVITKNDMIPSNEFAGENGSISKKLGNEYKAIIKANGEILSEVVVKSKKKTPLEELEEKYTTGAFSADARKTWDLTNSKDADNFLSIFDYLEATVPGLQVIRDDSGNIGLYYRQLPTISAMGNSGMTIFLDEVPTDPNTLSFVQPGHVALVKLYSYFAGAWGNAPGGALAIYLKKGEDLLASMPVAGEVINYNGFSVIKEFYSPDYSMPVKNNNPDDRITLHWKPDIFVNGKDIKVPVLFYNNDRTRSFKVVVEGMTTDGKMLLIEKIISPKAF